jgi:SAM-dependent methyltransferase
MADNSGGVVTGHAKSCRRESEGRVAVMSHAGLRQRVLGLPRGFELFQRLVGAPRSKAHFVLQYVRATPGDHILDVGCGTGAMLELLPPGVSYVGVDIDPGYVERARTRFEGRGAFVCASITTFTPSSTFDVVIGYGVLHHLNDDDVRAAIGVAEGALRPGGRALFAEPCRTSEQGWLERSIMSRDRGPYVRTTAEYVGLMRERFASISTGLDVDSYRLPYTFVILEANR